jgi:hypothetical protein
MPVFFAIVLLITLICPYNTAQAEQPVAENRAYDLLDNAINTYRLIDRDKLDTITLAREWLRRELDKNIKNKSDSILDFVGSGLWAGTLDVEYYGGVVFALNYHGLQIFDYNDLSSPLKNIPTENGHYYDQMVQFEHYLYFGRGDHLYIYDVIDPYDPVKLNELIIPRTFMTIQIDNNRAYFGRYARAFVDAELELCFFIYDIADPANPVPVGHYDLPATNSQDLRYFTIVGDMVYGINFEFSNLEIFSIADENNPEYVFRKSIPARVWGITNFGDYLITLSDQGICIFDLVNPNDPELVSIYPSTGDWAMERVGDLLYVNNYDGVRVYRISSKGYIEEVADIETREPWFNLTIEDSLLFTPSENLGFEIINISNLDSAFSIASYNPGTYGMSGIALAGDWVYTCRSATISGDGTKPLHICNISDKTNPVHINGVDASPNNFDIVEANNHLFNSNNSKLRGLQTFDLSDSANPDLMCQTLIPVNDLFLLDDSLLFATSDFEGVYIHDVSNGDCPEIIGQISDLQYFNCAMAVCADENYVYIMEQDFASWNSWYMPLYLHIVDYSDISQPVTTSLSYLDSAAVSRMEMIKMGNVLYVAAGFYGLLTFDISDPYSPVLADRYELNPGSGISVPAEYCANLTANRIYLFLAVNPTDVVHVLDIRNPLEPTPVEYLQLPSTLHHMEIRDDYLYTLTSNALYIHQINMPEIACGDANSDGNINLFDATFLINYVYLGGLPPYPLNVGDINNDAAINIFDITDMITYLYLNGQPPDCPEN